MADKRNATSGTVATAFGSGLTIAGASVGMALNAMAIWASPGVGDGEGDPDGDALGDGSGDGVGVGVGDGVAVAFLPFAFGDGVASSADSCRSLMLK